MTRHRYHPISDNRSENKKNFFCALAAVRGITGTGEAAGVDPVPTEDIEKAVSALFKLDRALAANLKDVLYN